MKNKQVVILGATTNPDRYAYIAAEMLIENGYDLIPAGIKQGEVFGKPIVKPESIPQGADTITLYINPEIQNTLRDLILNLKPRRIIFNPGTENYELMRAAAEQGIQCVEACTLVLLRTHQFESD